MKYCCYAIFVPGFVKIAFSCDPAKRVQEVQASCPLPVTRAVRFEFPTKGEALTCEASAHTALASDYFSGSWFVCGDPEAALQALRAAAATVCEASRFFEVSITGRRNRPKRDKPFAIPYRPAPEGVAVFKRRMFQRH